MATEDFERLAARFRANRQHGKLTHAWIKEVDDALPSPETRAEFVWSELQAIPPIDHYSLLCFCVQYLGGRAVGDLADDDIFVATARSAAQWLTNAHYFYGDKHLKELVNGPRGIRPDPDGGGSERGDVQKDADEALEVEGTE